MKLETQPAALGGETVEAVVAELGGVVLTATTDGPQRVETNPATPTGPVKPRK